MKLIAMTTPTFFVEEDQIITALFEELLGTGASTIVFHSLQAGHCPIHLELSFPQLLQYHKVLALAIRILICLIQIPPYPKPLHSTL